ncbi:hypothetical protein HT102_04745 [Hoyosella sp. G463]|uniref:DNA methylase adenine-specific domain-containing protein n=1 Tax=Lolliginicoccus lacisalsi TaxID=2742202 RepID=A0A927PLV9_9ACTN|nr:hypothetical protein [Lolliginicoccus lacisalsi]MBD8505792.1 hypothetical protein [Lolliginicoccus lacisalsi]
MPLERPTLSLSRIATLAQVQRPVVPVWRTRSTGSSTPSPQPVRAEGQGELFDAREVSEWLRATGRGNNPTAPEDAVAFAELAGSGGVEDQVMFQALTALLCLKVAVGEQLGDLGTEELLDLADDADPDDAYLYREIAAVDDLAPALAAWADQAASAAYSPVAAMERFIGRHIELATPRDPAVALTDHAAAVLARVAHAASGGATTVVDPTPGGSDLLVACNAAAAGAGVTARTVQRQDPASRLARRRLRAHDIHCQALLVDGDGAFQAPGDALVVAHLPAPSAPTMDRDAMLRAVDEIALQLTEGQVALVAAPASVLAKPLSGPSDEIRSGLLRSGSVRAIVALPKGWVRTTPQEHLTLWILAPTPRGTTPEQRYVLTADMANARFDGADLEYLLTDLEAGLRAPALAHAHAFRFSRLVSLPSLLTYRGDLTDTGAPTPRDPITGDEVAKRLNTLTRAFTEQNSRSVMIDIPVGRATAGQRPPTATIGWLITEKILRPVPGTRLDPGHIGATGGVRIIGCDELTGRRPLGERTIDAARFALEYPNARYTEPGDIVFATSPRIAAIVDYEGTSVVEAPARVLRLAAKQPVDQRGVLLPGVVAAGINTQPPHAKNVRAWPVRYTPPDQADELERHLRRIDNEQHALRQQLSLLAQLAHTAYDGVTRRSIALAGD